MASNANGRLHHVQPMVQQPDKRRAFDVRSVTSLRYCTLCVCGHTMCTYNACFPCSQTYTLAAACRYHIQPLPDKVTISYAKRSTGNATHGCLKTKTPKRQSKAPENTVGGALAPCKHCAKQAADALSARQELASVKHKCTALAKDLESLMEKSKDDAKASNNCHRACISCQCRGDQAVES